MNDAALTALAEAAGVAPQWKDVHGRWNSVAPGTLRYVLGAIGLPAATEHEVVASLAQLREGPRTLPPLVTASIGLPIRLPCAGGPYRLTLEDGTVQDGTATEESDTGATDKGSAVIPACNLTGYHNLEIAGQQTVLAVAPPRCYGIADAAAPGRRLWGLAAQLYSLRRPGDGGLGDFGALRDLVRAAGRQGASAVAISPVHAQFSADPDRFSPYSPSSRMLLNVLHADLPLAGPEAERLEHAELAEWPAASRLRLAALRHAFETADSGTLTVFEAWRAEQGDVLETHARFEALHAHLFGQDHTLWHWRNWPDEFRHPRSLAVDQFAAEHARDVTLHAFMQFLADRSLASAQQAAREADMAIGLVADLAVGADSGGSHCWSRQEETLLGLTIGAPPDLLSPQGQNWGLAAFSPRGLVQNGYAAYLEMLRAAMRHAGGVRIDHVMGLQRLWVVPDGQPSSAGAYLEFNLNDLLRLIAIESWRHRCVVLGEDLGTVPDGFQGRLQQMGLMGLRVLWFEREQQGEPRFTPPAEWTANAVAMTSTHDLATVAGWWGGRDLDWRASLGLLGGPDQIGHEHWLRERDRGVLWQAMQQSGAATGDKPPQHETWPAVDAAIRHIGRSPCELALLPLEDILALPEQPNLPGTMNEHPNWRRRLPGPAAELLDSPHVAARLATLDETRNAIA